MLKENKNGTSTDESGSVRVNRCLPLPVTLIVSYQGFEDYSYTVKSGGKTTDITIRLSPTKSRLGTTVVKVDRVSEKQKETPLTVESFGYKGY